MSDRPTNSDQTDRTDTTPPETSTATEDAKTNTSTTASTTTAEPDVPSERTDRNERSDTNQRSDTNHRGDMNNRNSDSSRRWLSAVVTLVGLWVIALPFVYQVTETALWNNVIVGAAIVALGAYNFYELSDRGTINVGSAGLAVLLGLWLIAAPFLLEFGSESVFWSTVASGVVVALLSGYNAYRGQNTETTTGTETRT